MNLHTGYFPPHGYRRKPGHTSFHLPSNNPAPLTQSAHSSVESNNGNESFLPSISAAIVHHEGRRPYHRNDFANNHLFLTNRRLEGIFRRQTSRNLQATSELIHLFDQQQQQQQPRRRKSNLHKNRQQDNAGKSSESDGHLSVVNLIMKPPPPPSSQIRDPLSIILRQRRSQINPPRVSRSFTTDAMNSTVKQNFHLGSLHTFTDDIERDDVVDNNYPSDALSVSIQPLDSSILCVKSIIPSAGPHHVHHHHLLQHR